MPHSDEKRLSKMKSEIEYLIASGSIDDAKQLLALYKKSHVSRYFILGLEGLLENHLRCSKVVARREYDRLRMQKRRANIKAAKIIEPVSDFSNIRSCPNPFCGPCELGVCIY